MLTPNVSVAKVIEYQDLIAPSVGQKGNNMKIAVIGYIGWYGSMAEWVADGFEANGHEVTRIDRKEMRDHLKPTSLKLGSGFIGTFGADISVFVDCSEDYSSSILEITEPKIFWSLDAHMPGGAERSVNIARKCDLVFSSNYEHGVKILEKFGIESYLMPVTYNHRYFDIHGAPPFDTVMIGHKNSPERVKLWELLSKYSSFCGKANRETDYKRYMNSTLTVVNQPTEPWDNILNNRFFEGMAGGAVVLQKRLKTDLIEKLGFIDGEDFVYWEDFGDLEEKLKYYIDFENRDEQHKMAWSGEQKVQQYSMKNQCAKIEAIILSKFYDRL